MKDFFLQPLLVGFDVEGGRESTLLLSTSES